MALTINPQRIGRLYHPDPDVPLSITVQDLLAATRLPDEATLARAVASLQVRAELRVARTRSGSRHARLVWLRGYLDLTGPRGRYKGGDGKCGKRHKLISVALGMGRVAGRLDGEPSPLIGAAVRKAQRLARLRHNLVRFVDEINRPLE